MPVDSTTSPYGKDASPAPKQNAALTGAARAFGKKPPVKPKPKPVVNSYSGNNGALAAAKRASPSRNNPIQRPDQPATDQRLIYQKSGSSIGSENDWEHSAFLQRRMGTGTGVGAGAGGHLQPPSSSREHSKSPSFIAATLAASRSVPASPNHTGQQALSPAALQKLAGSTRRSSASVRSGSSKGSSDHVLDTTPIPPTTSLIGMFERNVGTGPAPKKKPVKPVRKPSLEPRRPSSPAIPPLPAPAPVTPIKKPRSIIQSPKPVRPLSRGEPSHILISPKQVPIQRPGSAPGVRSKPIPIPPKPKPKPEVQKNEDQQASSDDSFVSASDYQPSIHARYGQRERTPSVTSSPRNRNIDSLANAIVASSLASSRAVSPSRSINSIGYPPPPPPTRRHLFHNSKEDARTPSPAKNTLRTTMRKPPKPDEEDDAERRRGRKHLMKKHPNKHHEGDRKRWRDEITPRERKRYEAVWASNKGLYPPPSSSSAAAASSEMSVCNLIVKDIFSRSRLHVDELEEVYSLVDRGQTGRLLREEFVVGLWLIDQRLKGRKLPIRVSDSVWRSASGVLGGIKVWKGK